MMVSIAKAEIRNLLKARWILWAIGFIAVVEFISAFSLLKISQVQNSPDPSGFEILGYSFRNGIYMVIFFLLSEISKSISGEENSGILKTILSKLSNRIDYLIGKLISHIFVGFGLIFFSLIVSIVLGGFWGDYYGLSEGTYIIISESDLWINLFGTVFLTTIPLGASVCMGLFFSVLSRKPGLAVVFTFGAMLGMFIFIFTDLAMVINVENKLLLYYLTFPADTFIDLSKGLPVLWTPKIYHVVLGSMIYSIFFYGMSYSIINRRDFS